MKEKGRKLQGNQHGYCTGSSALWEKTQII